VKYLVIALALALSATGADAKFTPRGIINIEQMHAPTCRALLQWSKQNPNRRDILGQWVLGFFTGMESQTTDQAGFENATGVELGNDQILNMLSKFCHEQPKASPLDFISGPTDSSSRLSSIRQTGHFGATLCQEL
jgi:hypothetical protein